jgi:hypothetical protein
MIHSGICELNLTLSTEIITWASFKSRHRIGKAFQLEAQRHLPFRSPSCRLAMLRFLELVMTSQRKSTSVPKFAEASVARTAGLPPFPLGGLQLVALSIRPLAYFKATQRVLRTTHLPPVLLHAQRSTLIPYYICATALLKLFDRGFSIAGTQYGNECYCGSSYAGGTPVTAPASECTFISVRFGLVLNELVGNVPCGGDASTMCGAGWRLSVYTKSTSTSLPAGWSAGGCVVDVGTRILQGSFTTSSSNSPASCAATCASQ